MNSSFEVNVNHCLRICMSRAYRTDLSHMAFCEHGQTAPQCPFGRAIHFFRSRDSGCVPSLLCNRCRIHYPEVFFRKNYNTYIPPIIICNGSSRKIFKRLYVCRHVMFFYIFLMLTSPVISVLIPPSGVSMTSRRSLSISRTLAS